MYGLEGIVNSLQKNENNLKFSVKLDNILTCQQCAENILNFKNNTTFNGFGIFVIKGRTVY